MELKQLEQYVGMLKNNDTYQLDVERVAIILAILSAYKKGIENKYLEAGDFNISKDYVKGNLKEIPNMFHQTIGYILSDIEHCYRSADKMLENFFYFNKTKQHYMTNNQRDYEQELIKSTRPQHALNDSPWVWLAAPVLLLGVLALGWVRMIIGV